jgi:drug/metabolite transporter (DMT)-like permease
MVTDMPSFLKPYAQLHFCVLLWGFTAILGKLISLQAYALVWWRMLLVSLILLAWPPLWSGLKKLSGLQVLRLAGIGLVVTLHWLTFYASIKWSNASVAATCMALGSVFTALFEPWLARRAVAWSELGLGLVTLPGVILVLGGIPADMRVGLAIGVFSAALTAIFTILNKRYASQHNALVVTFVEMTSGVMALTFIAVIAPTVFVLGAMPNLHDFILLSILAVVCTLLPFALSLVALRHCSAFSVQLAINLEPIYAIVLAIILLNEQRELSTRFYVGALLVLTAVMVQPVLSKFKR